MPDADVPAEILAIIETIAGAIRDELGEEIDAYPGLRLPERADPFNRAFRAIARAILRGDADDAEVPPTLVSQALCRVAERRLTAEGWDDRQVRHLIEQEPGSPDDWLVFLILSSRPQIEPLLKLEDPDPA
jgi:hypothetical protein